MWLNVMLQFNVAVWYVAQCSSIVCGNIKIRNMCGSLGYEHYTMYESKDTMHNGEVCRTIKYGPGAHHWTITVSERQYVSWNRGASKWVLDAVDKEMENAFLSMLAHIQIHKRIHIQIHKHKHGGSHTVRLGVGMLKKILFCPNMTKRRRCSCLVETSGSTPSRSLLPY